MKKFPRFADAVILHELTEPQAKLVLVALNALARQLVKLHKPLASQHHQLNS